jgi:hypothetical protein
MTKHRSRSLSADEAESTRADLIRASADDVVGELVDLISRKKSDFPRAAVFLIYDLEHEPKQGIRPRRRRELNKLRHRHRNKRDRELDRFMEQWLQASQHNQLTSHQDEVRFVEEFFAVLKSISLKRAESISDVHLYATECFTRGDIEEILVSQGQYDTWVLKAIECHPCR